MPFQKGQSGNPGGRSKAATEIRGKIMAATKDGRELIDIMLGIARGEHADAKVSDVLAAVKWLGDYGLGKPVERVEHSGKLSLEALVAGSFTPDKTSE